MKIARMLGATAVLFASLTLFGSPQAFANDPSNSTSGSSSGSSSSGSSSSGSSGSSGSSSSGSSSSGDDDSSSSSGSSSSGHDSSGSECDSDCQKKKDEKKNKKDSEPSTVVVIPSQTPTPRAPVRHYAPVAPPTDFVPDAPAETPILEQDAVSREHGELLTTPAGVSGDTPGVQSAAQTSETNEGDTGDAELSSTASPTATSGDSSPPWALIGGGLAVGLLGAGLAFAPSKKPPLPPPPPMNPTNHYPGY